ncbi:unnamed protein product [Strongylus vulgaris]|uniref:Uncharacterized protein n=1 Tax=Strongylus vulgaris TaxID=40348 RepID=A0A3P7IVX3_STRVU|nr:unnamed protein product [Strongylus vulgaris]
MDAALASEETMTCLSAVTMILDKLAGSKVKELHRILAFSPSSHPLVSIISQINNMEQTDERTKNVLQILDKFFQQLNDGSIDPKGLFESPRVPQIYGRALYELNKIYSKPLLLAVDGIEEARERTIKASRILVHRKHAVGTRMGSDVAKIIEAHRGKEKTVRDIIKAQMKYLEQLAAFKNCVYGERSLFRFNQILTF